MWWTQQGRRVQFSVDLHAVLLWRYAVPGDGLLAAAPVEADVRTLDGRSSAGGAGLVAVRGGAVALVRRHTITAVTVKPCGRYRCFE